MDWLLIQEQGYLLKTTIPRSYQKNYGINAKKLESEKLYINTTGEYTSSRTLSSVDIVDVPSLEKK